MRILVVEDEHKIANALKRGLEQEAFAVDVVYDGDAALENAGEDVYDLVILDRMLPGSTDGVGVLETMRKQGSHTPVLFLTAKDQLNERVEGLNAGADDYLVKPFAFDELLARVRALLRRPREGTDTVLRYKDTTLDPVSFAVSRSGKTIELTSKEFALLEYLMRNPERIVTKDMIIEHVWDYDADILPNTVEVYIGYLRAKLDKPFKKPPLLHTKHGFGYMFGEKT
jgi:DNA-binding response OmpR family regulator